MTEALGGVWLERAGDGPPVVLLHGLGDDHGLWRSIAPVLRERYDTLAVDLPGHGRSAPVGEPVSIEWFARQVDRALDAEAIEDPVVIGLSMGGGVAQSLALDVGRPMRGLVLVSTSPVLPEATRHRFAERAALAEREGMAAVIDATVSRWFTPAFEAARPDEVARTRQVALTTDPVSFAHAGRANSVRDFTARLGQIDVPVLFVGGTDDPAAPARAVALYRSAIPNLEVALFEGVSHLIPVEAPERLLGVLLPFLDRVTRGVAAGRAS